MEGHVGLYLRASNEIHLGLFSCEAVKVYGRAERHLPKVQGDDPAREGRVPPAVHPAITRIVLHVDGSFNQKYTYHAFAIIR